jgi:hypothetical protein
MGRIKLLDPIDDCVSGADIEGREVGLPAK